MRLQKDLTNINKINKNKKKQKKNPNKQTNIINLRVSFKHKGSNWENKLIS